MFNPSSYLTSETLPAEGGDVAATLDRWKTSLLDLSAVNPLVSLPETGLVEMGGSNDIFEPLVRRRKTLTYWDIANKNLDRAVLREAGSLPARASTMETLRRLYSEATSLLEGQDINVLFVAFGTLTWKDPSHGEIRRSPLLLLPITLERNADGSGFVITRMEEDVEVNPVLRLRLAQADIDVTLPPSPEESYLIPTSYFRNILPLLQDREGWEVEESCCLGRFPLLKLRLYEDLAAQDARAYSHPLVGALAGEYNALETLPAIFVPTADRLDEDESVAKDEAQEGRFHLLDADPAQERAILAALRGQSFVLQGPPGTGKTQTITNIVSECIAANKTVLLVSGRMASLDAVHHRLSDKGLGDLCLLAHSLRTSKRDILAQLENSLNGNGRSGGKGGGKSRDIEEMDSLRACLNEAAHELHRVRAPLGISLYQAHGILAECHAATGKKGAIRFEFADPQNISAEQYGNLENKAAQLAENRVVGEEAGTNIWADAFREPEKAGLQQQVEDTLRDGTARLRAVQDAARKTAAACNLPAPEKLDDAVWMLKAADAVAAAAAATPLPAAWLSPEIGDSYLPSLRERAVQFRDRYTHFRQDYAAFTDVYDPSILSLSQDQASERLLPGQEAILRPVFGEQWADEAILHHEEITTALKSLSQDARHAHQQLAAIAQRIDMPLDERPQGRIRILRIAKRAIQIEQASAGWFQAGAIPRLLTALDEAQIKWSLCHARTEKLFEAYTPAILQVDHASLKETQTGTQGFSRLLNPSVNRDAKILRSVLKPGLNPKERDIAADMELAKEVQDLRLWCDESVARLQEQFGIYFGGEKTDWSRLREALVNTEALCAEFPDSRVPVSLMALLVSRDGGSARLREMDAEHETVTTLFDDLRVHWDTLTRLIPAHTLPSPQEGLTPLIKWCDTLASALAEQHDVYQTVTRLRVDRDEDGSVKPVPVATLVADLRTAKRLRAEQLYTSAELEQMKPLYAPYFQGRETNWDSVCAALDAASALRLVFHEQERPLPPALLPLLTDPEKRLPEEDFEAALRIHLHDCIGHLPAFYQTMEQVFTDTYLRIEGTVSFRDASFAAQLTWLGERQGSIAEISKGAQLQGARSGYAAVGLGSFFDAMQANPAALPVARLAFRAQFHRLWAANAAKEYPSLQGFDGEAHGKKIERFRDLDRKQLEAVPARVREAAKARAPKMYPDEIKTLKGQLARRRTGEIRKLLAQIPNLLFALKPCVMMNPLSVRYFLDTDALRFDVVLFDDASQIATEDAIGAILRGKQVIIAGDPKQLPPLSLLRESGENFESVLDAASLVAAAEGPHFGRHTLNWHYRSQNESLIAFSRRHFYPDLVSFPSANAGSAIQYLNVAQEADEEARIGRIVDALVEYTRKYPQHTSGVVTLNDDDHDRIRDEIARRRTENPQAMPLPGEGRSRPLIEGDDSSSGEDSENFFVKTIENVQGDERDMLLLYFADPAKCEPLCQPGGDRLLNVATTRARRHMIVASAVAPEAMTQAAAAEQENAPQPAATDALLLAHEFLRYAETEAADNHADVFDQRSEEESAEQTAGTTDTAAAAVSETSFERVVEKALAARGLVMRRRIGVSDYRIDLAVVDPKQPECYLLGIETDGLTYGNAATARHRDRLRHEMLTERGWRLHRIWSQDWANEPEKQLRRIEAAVERIKPLK